MSGRFAARFAALGAAEGVLATGVFCLVAALALPAGARAPALVVALGGGLAYCVTVAALRFFLAARLRDPARVPDTAVGTSFAAALPAAALAGTRYGVAAALLVLGSAAAVALGFLRAVRSLAPDQPEAGRGTRLRDLLAGAALALAVASWATTAGTLLGGQAMLGLPGHATGFERAALLFAPAFILYALAVAALAGRTLAADLDRARTAVAAMASSGRLEQPLAVTSADEIGALTHALGELRTHLFAELVTYEQALDRAHKAEARKDSFFAQLTRELHAPLDAIVAEARALYSGQHGSMPPTQQNHVRVIESAAYHLLGLLSDVVDMTVLQSGALKLAPIELDAAALCRAVVRELGGLVIASHKPVTVRADAPAALPMRADPRRMRQILANLVTNAIKFTERGQVLVSARSDGAAGVRIAVSDTGPGIPAAELSGIFEEYRQADKSSARSGYGLGLAIAKHLVELHGGSLEVESTPGQGSTFTITMPGAS